MAKKKKRKRQCPHCGGKYVNLGAHMVKHDNKSKRGGGPSDGITEIKVVGVGGAGGNIVTRMRDKHKITGVEYVAINTDSQDLEHASAHEKVNIGKALTRGLGAGMNPDVGKRAAEENKSEIGEVVEGADIVFVTGGLGGGTGSGAGPVVAEIAQEKDVLVVGIVTTPFGFEGQKRASIAQESLGRMRDNLDALVVVPNDKVFSIIDEDTPIMEAFSYVDDVLSHGVQSIADLINSPGLINVDFADIESVLREAGHSLIGVGIADGKERSKEAVHSAVNSPLLDASIEGAKGALFSVSGGKDLKMSEVNDIAQSIVSNLDSNAQIIFGAYHDEGLKKDSVKVTVVATGFNGAVSRGGTPKAPNLFSDMQKSAQPKQKTSSKKSKKSKDGSSSKNKKKKSKNEEDDSSSWDVPAFLRKNKDK